MKANDKTDTQYNEENQHVRARKRHHDDGTADDVRGKVKFKIDTYLLVLDMLYTRQLEAYREFFYYITFVM